MLCTRYCALRISSSSMLITTYKVSFITIINKIRKMRHREFKLVNEGFKIKIERRVLRF